MAPHPGAQDQDGWNKLFPTVAFPGAKPKAPKAKGMTFDEADAWLDERLPDPIISAEEDDYTEYEQDYPSGKALHLIHDISSNKWDIEIFDGDEQLASETEQKFEDIQWAIEAVVDAEQKATAQPEEDSEKYGKVPKQYYDWLIEHGWDAETPTPQGSVVFNKKNVGALVFSGLEDSEKYGVEKWAFYVPSGTGKDFETFAELRHHLENLPKEEDEANPHNIPEHWLKEQGLKASDFHVEMDDENLLRLLSEKYELFFMKNTGRWYHAETTGDKKGLLVKIEPDTPHAEEDQKIEFPALDKWADFKAKAYGWDIKNLIPGALVVDSNNVEYFFFFSLDNESALVKKKGADNEKAWFTYTQNAKKIVEENIYNYDWLIESDVTWVDKDNVIQPADTQMPSVQDFALDKDPIKEYVAGKIDADVLAAAILPFPSVLNQQGIGSEINWNVSDVTSDVVFFKNKTDSSQLAYGMVTKEWQFLSAGNPLKTFDAPPFLPKELLAQYGLSESEMKQTIMFHKKGELWQFALPSSKKSPDGKNAYVLSFDPSTENWHLGVSPNPLNKLTYKQNAAESTPSLDGWVDGNEGIIPPTHLFDSKNYDINDIWFNNDKSKWMVWDYAGKTVDVTEAIEKSGKAKEVTEIKVSGWVNTNKDSKPSDEILSKITTVPSKWFIEGNPEWDMSWGNPVYKVTTGPEAGVGIVSWASHKGHWEVWDETIHGWVELESVEDSTVPAMWKNGDKNSKPPLSPNFYAGKFPPHYLEDAKWEETAGSPLDWPTLYSPSNNLSLVTWSSAGYWQVWNDGNGTWDKLKDATQAYAPVAADQPIEKQGWDDKLTKLSGQTGSTNGGLFQDTTTNKKYYVKYPGKARAQVELLASQLYGLASVPSATAELIEHAGDKHAIASHWIDDVKSMDALDMRHNNHVLNNFAIDAWLANWDVVGMEADNIVMGPDGVAYRIDPGGALTFRAQGGEKDFSGTKVDELRTFLDGNINPSSAEVFAGLKQEHKEAGAKKLAQIDNKQIAQIVDATDMTAEEKTFFKDRLAGRRNIIVKEILGEDFQVKGECKPGFHHHGVVAGHSDKAFEDCHPETRKHRIKREKVSGRSIASILSKSKDKEVKRLWKEAQNTTFTSEGSLADIASFAVEHNMSHFEDVRGAIVSWQSGGDSGLIGQVQLRAAIDELKGQGMAGYAAENSFYVYQRDMHPSEFDDAHKRGRKMAAALIPFIAKTHATLNRKYEDGYIPGVWRGLQGSIANKVRDVLDSVSKDSDRPITMPNDGISGFSLEKKTAKDFGEVVFTKKDVPVDRTWLYMNSVTHGYKSEEELLIDSEAVEIFRRDEVGRSSEV